MLELLWVLVSRKQKAKSFQEMQYILATLFFKCFVHGVMEGKITCRSWYPSSQLEYQALLLHAVDQNVDTLENGMPPCNHLHEIQDFESLKCRSGMRHPNTAYLFISCLWGHIRLRMQLRPVDEAFICDGREKIHIIEDVSNVKDYCGLLKDR